MNEILFVKVGDYRVALAHIIEWEYTEAYTPATGEIDDETGKPVQARRSKISVTTTEQCADVLSHHDGEIFGVGVAHVERKAFGKAADFLREQLNRMVIS